MAAAFTVTSPQAQLCDPPSSVLPLSLGLRKYYYSFEWMTGMLWSPLKVRLTGHVAPFLGSCIVAALTSYVFFFSICCFCYV